MGFVISVMSHNKRSVPAPGTVLCSCSDGTGGCSLPIQGPRLAVASKTTLSIKSPVNLGSSRQVHLGQGGTSIPGGGTHGCTTPADDLGHVTTLDGKKAWGADCVS